MPKRRLPLLASDRSDDSPPAPLAAWAGVAFFCTLLTWLPLAALVHRATDAALEVVLRGRFSPANTTRVALAVLAVAHLGAYAASVFAGAFVVGRFGTAPGRSVALGVGVLVGAALSLAGAGSWAVGAGAALLLGPLGYAAGRAGFRRGRRR